MYRQQNTNTMYRNGDDPQLLSNIPITTTAKVNRFWADTIPDEKSIDSVQEWYREYMKKAAATTMVRNLAIFVNALAFATLMGFLLMPTSVPFYSTFLNLLSKFVPNTAVVPTMLFMLILVSMMGIIISQTTSDTMMGLTGIVCFLKSGIFGNKVLGISLLADDPTNARTGGTTNWLIFGLGVLALVYSSISMVDEKASFRVHMVNLGKYTTMVAAILTIAATMGFRKLGGARGEGKGDAKLSNGGFSPFLQ